MIFDSVLLASVVLYNSEIHQPVRAAAALSKHPRTRQAAPSGREQCRAGSLHPDAESWLRDGASKATVFIRKTTGLSRSTQHQEDPTRERSPQSWQSYEQVAVEIMNNIATMLGLEGVEGKQSVYGPRTGTDWEIDGKGVKVGGESFVIIECRRYST